MTAPANSSLGRLNLCTIHEQNIIERLYATIAAANTTIDSTTVYQVYNPLEAVSTTTAEAPAEVASPYLNPTLTLETIRPLFEMRQVDAAEELGVSASTLKRACKALRIGRWPWRKLPKTGKNPEGNEEASENKSEEGESDADSDEQESAGVHLSLGKRRSPEMEKVRISTHKPSRGGAAGGRVVGGGAKRRVPKSLWHFSQHALGMRILLKAHGKSLHPRFAENADLVAWC